MILCGNSFRINMNSYTLFCELKGAQNENPVLLELIPSEINNWFHNRFTDSALLKQTSLIEAYAFAISKTVAK